MVATPDHLDLAATNHRMTDQSASNRLHPYFPWIFLLLSFHFIHFCLVFLFLFVIFFKRFCKEFLQIYIKYIDWCKIADWIWWTESKGYPLKGQRRNRRLKNLTPQYMLLRFSFYHFRKILNRNTDCLLSEYTGDNLQDLNPSPLADSQGKSMWTPWNGTSFWQPILPWRKYKTFFAV